jgi:hypothetical protein
MLSILEFALDIATGIIVVGLLIALGLFFIQMIITYPWQTASVVICIVLIFYAFVPMSQQPGGDLPPHLQSSRH